MPKESGSDWVSCSMPIEMKKDLQEYVKNNNYGVSEFIRKLIRDTIYLQ